MRIVCSPWRCTPLAPWSMGRQKQQQTKTCCTADESSHWTRLPCNNRGRILLNEKCPLNRLTGCWLALRPITRFDYCPDEQHGHEQDGCNDPNDEDNAACHTFVEDLSKDDGVSYSQIAIHTHGQNGKHTRTGCHSWKFNCCFTYLTRWVRRKT